MSNCIRSRRLTFLVITVAFCLTTYLAIPILPIDYSYGTRQTATVQEPSLTAEEIVTGLKLPTSMAFLGQDDILVSEKNTGKVQRIINGTTTQEPSLDIHVANRGERGLLGLAISHPDHHPPPHELQHTGGMINSNNNYTYFSVFY